MAEVFPTIVHLLGSCLAIIYLLGSRVARLALCIRGTLGRVHYVCTHPLEFQQETMKTSGSNCGGGDDDEMVIDDDDDGSGDGGGDCCERQRLQVRQQQ